MIRRLITAGTAMHHTRRCLVLTAIASAVVNGAADAQPGPLGPDQTFTRLKSLVGDWQGRTEGGRTFLVSYRLIASDSVLVETWTMSPTRTSMTVYHMDGATLIATHYCPQRNQPRLQYHPKLSGQRLEFRFRDATNLQDPHAAHQHAFWIEISPGAAAFSRNETYVENGEAGSETTTFTRLPQPTSNP
jgi:hypothetical protein